MKGLDSLSLANALLFAKLSCYTVLSTAILVATIIIAITFEQRMSGGDLKLVLS